MRRITRLRFDNDIHFHPRRRGDHPVYGQVPHSSKQDQMSFIRFAASAPRNAGASFLLYLQASFGPLTLHEPVHKVQQCVCTNCTDRGPVWTKNKHFLVRSSVKSFYTASEKHISSIEKFSWPKIFKLHTSTSGGFWRPEGPKSLVAAGIIGLVVVWWISCFHCVHSLSFVLSPPNQDSTGGKPESSVLSALSCNCEMRCTTNVSGVFLRQVIPLLIDRSCWPKTCCYKRFGTFWPSEATTGSTCCIGSLGFSIALRHMSMPSPNSCEVPRDHSKRCYTNIPP